MNVSLVMAPAATPVALDEDARAAYFANPNVSVVGVIAPLLGRIATFPLDPATQARIWQQRWVESTAPLVSEGDVILFHTIQGLFPWRVVKSVTRCIVLEPLQVIEVHHA